ncbi:hypothetical protein BCV69DRAFT_285102 [Microstroma glucosiphilum]|uniref:Uncharacterized protein n=1 Tax=Pseudomicrostroma glucosiphilum TaxID=1684307 RepID=A0A316TZ08_9BASI|nr:hypothetical protein BCV69DRAFT_285102 [Pseudomicrostroma glucosiphilum]PWN18476.1 hypothetical protein BCV69DRAFT_285102 [Pseudomicrostroma glucosiphilum]
MAKPAKKGSAGSSSRQHAPSVSDPRFNRLQTDPRFLRPQKEASKVLVDDRFRGLLDGKDFGINQDGKKGRNIDRFGRKKGKGSKEEEEMKRLYRLEEKRSAQDAEESGEEDEEDDEEEEESEGDEGFVDYARGAADLESSSDEDSSEDDEDEDESSEEEDDVAIGSSNLLRKERRRQRARGSSASDSDSEQDEDDESVSSVDPKILAQLDAEAAAAIRQGEAEGSSDEEGAAASSSKASKRERRKKREEKVPLGGETRRLAIVNLDWDHVRSLDLYKIFSSLVSPLATRLPGTTSALDAEDGSGKLRRNQASIQVRGTVEQVRVYPSEFGQERMKKEDIEGPPKDIFKSGQDAAESSSKSKKKRSSKGKGKRRDADEDSDDSDVVFEVDDGGEFDEEALRKYQLDRLRYYYAVATFDSAAAARHVYDEVDGTEMERTANVFDLRFVPDGMEFPSHPISEGDDGWRDEAKPGIDDNVTYKGVDWATDALRHSKVRLTWDAPDPERQKIIRRAMTKDDLRDDDFKAYLASDTEDDDDEDAAAQGNGKAAAGRDRFRALLGMDDGAGATAFSKKKHASAFQDGRGSDDEGAAQGDMEITFLPGLSEAAARKAKGNVNKEDGEETTLEKYLRKQREKKERRKAAREGEGEEEEEATLSKPKESDLGFDDPFFASGGEEEDVDLDEALAQENRKSSSKADKKKPSKKSKEARDDTTARADELALLVDSEEADGGRNHFDMKDILKSESKSGKKLNRWERKKAKKAGLDAVAGSGPAAAARVGAAQDGFKLDVNDARFGDLMSNHEYALDPTHPSFMKTDNMKKLMEERRKRSAREGGEDGEAQLGGGGGGKKRKGNESQGGGGDASELLRNLKKRQNGQMGKAKKGTK